MLAVTDIWREAERTRKQALAMVRAGCVCEYCEAAEAEGVVGPSMAAVCEACYEDHHGGF